VVRRFYLKKDNGTPPAERSLSFHIIPETKVGVKIIDERPVVTVEGAACQVIYDCR